MCVETRRWLSRSIVENDSLPATIISNVETPHTVVPFARSKEKQIFFTGMTANKLKKPSRQETISRRVKADIRRIWRR